MSANNKERDFEKVYRKYYTQLFYKALDWTLDENAARDLVGDLYADLWERIDSIRMDEVAGFLNTALRNRVINYLRHLQVERKYEDEYVAVMNEIMEEPDDIHERQLKLVEQVLSEQTAQRRFIFEQCCIEGKTYKEVSAIVGIEVSTVHKHISKVYSELRERLAEMKKMTDKG